MSDQDDPGATAPPAAAGTGQVRRDASPPHLLLPGDLIAGRYLIERFLARGGMGEVYQAADLELKEPVALKTVRVEHLDDARSMARLKREIQLARRVTHPNVCRIFDLGLHRLDTSSPAATEVVFLTMELLLGETLAERLAARGPLTPVAALPLVRQMANGLAAAHRAGIIHRDLKTRNVILVPSPGGERAVLVDFGLARAIGIGGGDSVDLGGAGFGTPSYMAPEQVERGPITPATDQYALGVVIYEMVTGRLPFTGTPLEAALERVRVPPPSPRQHVPDLDPAWEAAILRCLERDPRNRFASTDDVVRALVGEPVPRRRRLGRRAVGAGALMLAAGVAIALAYSLQTERANPHVNVRMRPAVAVLGFQDRSGEAGAGWISPALTEVIAADLAVGGTLRVLANDSVARMKLELGLADAETLPSETLARVYSNLGVDYAVLGSYRRSETGIVGEVRAELRLQDARTGTTLASVAADGGERDLVELGSRSSARLRERLGARGLSAGELTGVRAVLPADFGAVRLYAEGLARLRAFDSAGARDRLERAVQSEPSFALGHLGLSRALSWTRPETAREEAKRAFELATSLPEETRLRVEAHHWLAAGESARAMEVFGRLWRASPDELEYGVAFADAARSAGKVREFASCIEMLRDLPPPAGTDPRVDLAQASMVAIEDPPQSAALIERAAVEAEARKMVWIVAKARDSQSRPYAILGDLPRASSAYEAAQASYARVGDRRAQALALRNLGVLLHVQGARAESGERLDEALALFQQIGDSSGIGLTLKGIAEGLLAEGDLAGARSKFEQALVTLRDLGWDVFQGGASEMARLSEVLREQAEFSESGRLAEQALALRRKRAVGVYAPACIVRADILLDLGEPAAARRVLEEPGPCLQDAEPTWVAEMAFHIALIDYAEGDVVAARRKLEEAARWKDKLPYRWDGARMRTVLASLLIDDGRSAEAESAVREAIGVFAAQGRLNDEVWAEGVLARALRVQGKGVESRAAIERATTRWETRRNPRSGFVLTLEAARVRAASGTPAEIAAATASLAAMIAETDRLGAVALGLEARLALGEIEIAAGQAAAGHTRLSELEATATRRGFGLIARKASRARR